MVNNENIELVETEEYKEFVDKFKIKLTTDDCYTPAGVYEIVKKFAMEQYKFGEEKIVRPFWPGGDYESYDYPDGCVVLDNPPFSIVSKIVRFYLDRDIKFFLFAPGLTSLKIGSDRWRSVCKIYADARITYENGASVPTAFVTNMDKSRVAYSAPILHSALKEEYKERSAKEKKQMPKYVYPDSVLTAAQVNAYALRGVYYEVNRDECEIISALDSQKPSGKAIYGGGLLLSDRERADRERADRERADRERAEVWELSDREKEIISNLSEDRT